MNAKKILSAAALLCVVSGVSFAAGKAAAPAKSTVLPNEAVVWEEYAPGVPLKVGKLWGDRAKGEYAMFLKMPAGMEAGFHAHTGDYWATNVAGTWQHWTEGETPKDLKVGSFVHQVGKEMHNDKCVGTEDCVLFVIQKQKGDYIPKTVPKDAPKADVKTDATKTH